MADRIAEVGPAGPGQRTTTEIVQHIADSIQDIVRSEIQLAKTELSERAKKAARAAGIMAAGIFLCLIAFLLIVATATAAVAIAIPVWGACLVIGVLLLAIGGGMAIAGRGRLKQTSLKPDRTISSVRSDVAWIKQQTK
jgi:uncharacterized membrane protein YqjE